MILKALTLARDRHAPDHVDDAASKAWVREVALAVRELGGEWTERLEFQPTSDYSLTTSWASVTGFPVDLGTYRAERELWIAVNLYYTATGTKNPFNYRIQVDGVNIHNWRLVAPLTQGNVTSLYPKVVVAKGPHTLDLQGIMDTGGGWDISTKTVVRCEVTS